MGERVKLQQLLEAIPGVAKVYFQPPNNTLMQYPCIVYDRDNVDMTYADNGSYRQVKRYSVTVMDRDPDSAIPDQVGAMPLTSFDRHFVSDGLHHDIYNVYF
jgi:hypothetical protein